MKRLVAKFKTAVEGFVGNDDSVLRAMDKASSPEMIAKLMLPESVSRLPKKEMDEPQRLILSFKYFNEKACIFETADQAKLSSLLKKLALIENYTAKQFSTCDLKPKPAYNNGKYEKLFKNLEDVQKLHEIKIAGQGTFYGFIYKNVFYLVAVDANHRNTG